MEMKTSDHINEVASAMSKAQADMHPAIKDSTNPHFKSKYADLSAVWTAARPALAKHGLTIVQDLTNAEGSGVAVTTRIIHTSGQWIETGPLVVPMAKNDAHGIGSASSYGKRYGLSAALGVVAEEDDDGNAAAAGGGKLPAQPKPTNGAAWTIKADSPEAFVKAFVEKMAKAPNLDAANKLHEDNKPNLQALAEEQYQSCAAAYDAKVQQYSKQAAE
jgi:hypothetical protein